LWIQGNKSELTVCFAGTAVEFRGAPLGVLKLIQDLNAGKSCRLDSYLKGRLRAKHRQGLQTLASAGAFQIIG
jgi:hypothetical protein